MGKEKLFKYGVDLAKKRDLAVVDLTESRGSCILMECDMDTVQVDWKI